MITAEFLEDGNDEWEGIPSLSIGQKSDFEIQYIKVGLLKLGTKHLLLHIHATDQCTCFKSLKINGNHIVIGFGEMAHFVNIENESIISKKLDGYFGDLYTPDDFDLTNCAFSILVASANYLHHYTFSGEEIWKSEMLGIDGVNVRKVEPPLVYISGEWDPPGGWEQKI